MLDRAGREHPSLPDWLFRWSEANQLWFLAFRCLRAGRRSEGVRLLIATFRRDPSFILRPTVRQTLMRGLSARFSSGAVSPEDLSLRRPFLDRGPPPDLEVPRMDSRIERWRARQIARVSVRTVPGAAPARSDRVIETSPGLMPTGGGS